MNKQLKILSYFFCFIAIIGCEHDTTIERSGNKLRFKYIYSDSNEEKPYSYTEYFYVYSSSGDKEITEIYYKGPYGEYIKEKITRLSGKKIEHIKYHPTFQGAEWWCKRYEYN